MVNLILAVLASGFCKVTFAVYVFCMFFITTHAQVDRSIDFQLGTGFSSVIATLPNGETYKNHSYRLNPNIGFYATQKLVVGLQGEYHHSWDSQNNEFPKIWGGGLFAKYYLGYWEYVDTVPRENKKDREYGLRIRPVAKFSGTLFNGYYMHGTSVFQHDFKRVIQIIANLGLEINLFTFAMMEMRMGLSLGLRYYPVTPIIPYEKIASAPEISFHLVF